LVSTVIIRHRTKSEEKTVRVMRSIRCRWRIFCRFVRTQLELIQGL